jgi:hypothetical protein
MTNGLAEIRGRIHRKSEEYFTLSHGRRGAKAWRMFYGATDALLDASMAAMSYEKAVRSDPAIDLLVCYGFLQALYIQQDAVWTISRSLGLKWRPNDDPRIREIRELRNRLTGHPALAGENDKSKRLSSAVIGYNDVKPSGFSGWVYFEGNVEQVNVHASTILRENQDRLAVQMLAIEAEIDRQENLFRSEQAMNPLSEVFATGFDYLLQRLRPDLDDDARIVQATAHSVMVRERITKLEEELTTRNLKSETFSYELSVIVDAIELIDKMIAESDRSPKSQNKIDIVYDGFVINMNRLRSHVSEIDGKFLTSVNASAPQPKSPS